MPSCPRCEKPEPLCVCNPAHKAQCRLKLVVLRHPQEPDRALGSAPLLRSVLSEQCEIVTGLSWSNLSKAIGGFASDPELGHPSRWAVLFAKQASEAGTQPDSPVSLLDRKGNQIDREACHELSGVLLLDGTWSQAKTLWWRNAWLLKLPRIQLQPKHPSLYGKVRREPRRECLSTLEAAAMVLEELERNPGAANILRAEFERFLSRYQEAVRSASVRPNPA